MSNPRDPSGLVLIPEHMRQSILWWTEKGEPHPSMMGSFLRALLSNDLMNAFAFADEDNAASMHGWAKYLYNFAPSTCFGSAEKLEAWHAAHHEDAA